jgi:hypothetical protein
MWGWNLKPDSGSILEREGRFKRKNLQKFFLPQLVKGREIVFSLENGGVRFLHWQEYLRTEDNQMKVRSAPLRGIRALCPKLQGVDCGHR